MDIATRINLLLSSGYGFSVETVAAIVDMEVTDVLAVINPTPAPPPPPPPSPIVPTGDALSAQVESGNPWVYWRLQDSPVDAAANGEYDASQRDITGTVGQGPGPGNVSGQGPKAYDLAWLTGGSGGDAITVVSPDKLANLGVPVPVNGWAFGMWVKVVGVTSAGTVINVLQLRQNDDATMAFTLAINGDQLQAVVGSNGTVVGSFASDGNWHLIGVSRDAGTDQIVVSVDGVQLGADLDDTGGAAADIGGTYWVSNAMGAWDITEIALYAHPVTLAEFVSQVAA